MDWCHSFLLTLTQFLTHSSLSAWIGATLVPLFLTHSFHQCGLVLLWCLCHSHSSSFFLSRWCSASLVCLTQNFLSVWLDASLIIFLSNLLTHISCQYGFMPLMCFCLSLTLFPPVNVVWYHSGTFVTHHIFSASVDLLIYVSMYNED